MHNNVIFLHIPKAAGSTLRAIIRRQYSDSQIHVVSSVPDLQQSISQFRNLPQSERAEIRCLMGHGTYGLHNELSGSTEYLTMFRRPVSRVISNYYYVRRSPEHRLYEEVTKDEMSLHEYVSSGVNAVLDNQMVRHVTGMKAGDGKPDAETLQQAISNLDEQFGVVGLVERFDESLLLMKRRYGWSDVSYRKHNVTSSRPRKEDLPANLIQEIEERNHLDNELYQYAARDLNRELQQLELNSEIRRLRFQCWLRSANAEIRRKAGHWLSALGLR